MTDNQLEMLCEMSDIHLKWFKIYSPEINISYEEVLKLNHIKMIDILKNCTDLSEEMIDVIFKSTIRDYQEMLDDLNLD